jgi:hypothetical protein
VVALHFAGDRNRHITPQEMFGLEAIVMKANRPVVFVRGNSYDDVGAPWSNLNAAEVKTRLSAIFPLIGRIERPTSPIIRYPGTGFVVGKGLVATRFSGASCRSSSARSVAETCDEFIHNAPRLGIGQVFTTAVLGRNPTPRPLQIRYLAA